MQKRIDFIKKYLSYVAITLTLVLSYFTFGDNIEHGVTKNSALYTHIAYIFVHANLFHLCTNVFSLLFTLRLLKKMANIKFYVSLTIGLISAFASSFILMQEIPTVGASGVVYALLGMYCYLRFDMLALRLLAMLVGINVFQFIFGNINVYIHLFSLIFGFIGVAIWDSYYVLKVIQDEKRKRNRTNRQKNK